MKEIAIGSDHAGFRLKNRIVDRLKYMGYEVKDFGCYSEESVDYPDHIHPVAQYITDENEIGTFGIIICGSGNGAAMTANKHSGIRCALCWNDEITRLAREHNNANIISIPSRFVDDELAFELIDIFLNTEFEGGRHERRINKININSNESRTI